MTDELKRGFTPAPQEDSMPTVPVDEVTAPVPEARVEPEVKPIAEEKPWYEVLDGKKKEEQEPKPEESEIPETEEPYAEEQEEAEKRSTQEAINSGEEPEATRNETPVPEDVAAKNDVSDFVYVDNGTDEDWMDTLDAALADEEARGVVPDRENGVEFTPEQIRMYRLSKYGQRTNQSDLLTSVLVELKKLNVNLTSMNPKIALSKVKIAPSTNDKGPRMLTSNTALSVRYARTVGLFKVPLYNSGFWISVRPVKIEEMYTFLLAADREFKEFGRILGGHAHLYTGMLIKQKFIMELLPSLIVNSNFEGFRNPELLADVISFHDYDTLMWAFASLMYREGIGISIHCTNPECRYVAEHQMVDLVKGLQLNTSVLNEKAMTFLVDGMKPGVIRTKEELDTYRNELLGTNTIYTIESQNAEIHMKVPTMKEYLDHGNSLISKLSVALNMKLDTTNVEISNRIMVAVPEMLTSFVKKIVYHNPGAADDIADGSTPEGRDVVEDLISNTIGNEIDLPGKMKEYIGKTKAVYFGTTMLKCPKCGKSPNNETDGFLPWDTEYLFFGLCSHVCHQKNLI